MTLLGIMTKKLKLFSKQHIGKTAILGIHITSTTYLITNNTNIFIWSRNCQQQQQQQQQQQNI